MAASEVTKIRPEDHSIPEAAAGAERACILIAFIAPLALTHPLLTAPYMSPTAAYTLISEITTAWNWDAPLAPLMIWIRTSLYQTCLGVKSLPPLDMADHITVGRQNLQRNLVPRIPAGPVTPSPTYTVHQAQQLAQSYPSKNNIPAES